MIYVKMRIILKENLLAKIDKSKVNFKFILYLTNQILI